jgi:pyrroline-5-carboxylate reductase
MEHATYTAGMNALQITFVGAGHMAGALIGGLLKAGLPAAQIRVIDPMPEARERAVQRFGVAAFERPDATVLGSNVIVWAVKPQSFAEAAEPFLGFVAHCLHLSVMAGIRIETLRKGTGGRRIVRAMPNTPALIGRGISALFASEEVGDEHRQFAEQLLAPTGAVTWVEQEAQLDAVTALSGSGPAYVYYMLEAMVQAGEALGLPPAQARQLAQATIEGAAALATQSPLQPAELRAQVTSKGGTTQAALEVLDAQGVKASFVQAIEAAARRAGELGDEYGRIEVDVPPWAR